MYTVEKQLISANRSHTPLNAQGIVVHCTDTPRATAQNERDAFNNHPEFQASAHAFIDAATIIQTIPTNEKAWHAGPTANKKYLGVELCMARNASEFQQIWNRAVWLFAYWMENVVKVTTINSNNLLSHAEVSRRFGETDHTDPIDYFAKYGKTVDMFRSAVQFTINGTSFPPAPSDNQSQGNDVLKLQQMLNRLKITDAKGNSLSEDNIMGSHTKEATKRFQSICNLSVDGIAGPETWGVMDHIIEKPLLQVGSTGAIVRYLQYRVGCSYDGIFGWDTNRYVAIWQGQNGCSQDGIVGSQTWSKMIGNKLKSNIKGENIMTTRAALFIHAHQDDEVLSFGGGAINHQAYGIPTFIATITDGTGSGVKNQSPFNGWTMQQFSDVRNQETANAIYYLGATKLEASQGRLKDNTLNIDPNYNITDSGKPYNQGYVGNDIKSGHVNLAVVDRIRDLLTQVSVRTGVSKNIISVKCPSHMDLNADHRAICQACLYLKNLGEITDLRHYVSPLQWDGSYTDTLTGTVFPSAASLGASQERYSSPTADQQYLNAVVSHVATTSVCGGYKGYATWGIGYISVSTLFDRCIGRKYSYMHVSPTLIV